MKCGGTVIVAVKDIVSRKIDRPSTTQPKQVLNAVVVFHVGVVDILSFVSVGHVVENARLVDVDGGRGAHQDLVKIDDLGGSNTE